MELVDEPDLHAPHPGALRVRQGRAIDAIEQHAAAAGLSSSPIICRSEDLPDPEGPTSATASPS